MKIQIKKLALWLFGREYLIKFTSNTNPSIGKTCWCRAFSVMEAVKIAKTFQIDGNDKALDFGVVDIKRL